MGPSEKKLAEKKGHQNDLNGNCKTHFCGHGAERREGCCQKNEGGGDCQTGGKEKKAKRALCLTG